MNSILNLSDKKRKRNESKKRKIQAFLDLAKSNDEDRKRRFQSRHSNHPATDTGTNSVHNNGSNLLVNINPKQNAELLNDEDFKALKAALKERQKSKEKRPVFYLTGPGATARYPLQDVNKKMALYVQDIQHLLLLATMGHSFSYGTRWCRIIRYQKVSHVVFLTIDGFSPQHLESPELANSKALFKENIVEFISPFCYNSSFLGELIHVPLSLTITRKFLRNSSACHSGSILKPLKSLFSITRCKSVESERAKDAFPRTHLLLSVPQMLAEGFPMPFNGHPDSKNYCFTKSTYKEVTETSPLFAIDCEMCITTEGTHELTRISVMDEKLNVLYDTLVKPRNKITNYVTKFSGITESMLAEITTRLEDVQKVVQKLLPEDAILCGQSLNFDLHAMKMMHPYIIDTSVIYNITGFRSRKSSLKCLSQVFLKRDIQCGNNGHDSIEDGLATMELVQLKLSMGLQFGDVLLGGDVLMPTDEPMEKGSFSNSNCNSLLNNVVESGKSACVVGAREKVSEYVNGAAGAKLKQVHTSSSSEIIQRTVENAIEHDLTFAHVPVKTSSETNFSEVDSAIQTVYNACADRALFIVAFIAPSGNGVCMVKVKDMSPFTAGRIHIMKTEERVH